MAYGLVCKHCGWQETEHRDLFLADSPGEKKEGFCKALAKCPGFQYHPEDYETLFNSYFEDGGPGIPDELAEAYDAFKAKKDPHDFRRSALESIGNQHTAWAGYIGVRRLAKAEERAEELRDAYQFAKPAEKRAIEQEMKMLERNFGEYFRYHVSR